MKKALMIFAGLLLATSAWAQDEVTPRFGLGASAGIDIPVAQDDQASGMVFGFRGRLKVIPLLILEPNINFVKWGGPDAIDGVDLGIDGSKVTSFGLDVTLGNAIGSMGVSPFLVAGAASYKVENDDTGFDESNLGFSGGIGIGIGLSPRFALDIRGKAIVIPIEGSSSKKSVAVTGGLNVNF